MWSTTTYLSKSFIIHLKQSSYIEYHITGINRCKSKKDWPVQPAGVKFDPTDQELIEHLEAKVSADSARSHPLIDLFIPTIDSEYSICYTQPEKLPSMTLISRLLAQTYSFVYSSIFLFRRKPGEAITI